MELKKISGKELASRYGGFYTVGTSINWECLADYIHEQRLKDVRDAVRECAEAIIKEAKGNTYYDVYYLQKAILSLAPSEPTKWCEHISQSTNGWQCHHLGQGAQQWAVCAICGEPRPEQGGNQ